MSLSIGAIRRFTDRKWLWSIQAGNQSEEISDEISEIGQCRAFLVQILLISWLWRLWPFTPRSPLVLLRLLAYRTRFRFLISFFSKLPYFFTLANFICTMINERSTYKLIEYYYRPNMSTNFLSLPRNAMINICDYLDTESLLRMRAVRLFACKLSRNH